MKAARALLPVLSVLTLLSGCEDSESGSSFGSYTAVVSGSSSVSSSAAAGGLGGAAAAPGGTKDTVIATASVPGTVSVTAGSSQTVSVTFTSSDGRSIHGLALTSTTLPADWSGTDDYGCTLVGAGSSCVLNLTYSPAAAESGSLTITYIYINNAGQPITPGGTVTIPYVATAPNNNVEAVTSPVGQIVAPTSSRAQSVSLNFTSDDGNAATNLALTTDLSSLPAGWQGPASGFSCDIVSNGNGCHLVLSYAPTTAASGILSLGYTYTDDAGNARTGNLNIPYSTTTNGTIVATTSPAGQVNAVAKTGKQAVTVTFTTDDGKTAGDLELLSSLSSLPPGWSSAATAFTCGSVGSGNGCQLTLDYAPGAIASGTVSLNYSYRDAGNTYNVGSFNIDYAATTNDNVVGTAAPSGSIDTVVGDAPTTVNVTFTTDDGQPATALQVTTDLTSLSGGWSSTQNTFACSGVNGGTTCVLPLTFNPQVAESGTLTVAYQYKNNAGQLKTGTVNIPYVATTNDNVNALASVSSLSVLTGSTTPVTVTFVTDDGNPATNLTIDTGLAPLPAGWSAASSFTCATIASGAGCQLGLNYAPTVADNNSLALHYTYTNNAGMAKSGTVVIAYTAADPPPPPP